MRLNEIYDTYKNDVEFFCIYIHEAHPSDGWQTPQNLYDEVVYSSPSTHEERSEIASTCQIDLDIKLPMLIDGIDNAVEEAYVSEPIRMYLIDREGILTFNGALGPQGFNPDDWEAAIQQQLAIAAE